MPNLQPVSRNRHGTKRWRRYSDYRFATQDMVAPLVATELPKALLTVPIAFLTVEGNVQPFAIQALAPGQNLFVAPDGHWLAGYIPAVYRSHPFRLATTEHGEQVLCIDEDAGQVTDGPEGEPFFTDEGQPATSVRAILDFLTRIEQDRGPTMRACGMLQKHELIQPWPVKVQTAEGEKVVQGLSRLDEVALNALPADAFIELRDAGALLVAYCQLMSMQHLSILGKLAEAHAIAAQSPTGDAKPEFLNNETISFGNLR